MYLGPGDHEGRFKSKSLPEPVQHPLYHSFISAFMEEVKQIYDHDDDCCFDPTWNDEKANNTVMMFGSSGFVNSTGYFEPAHMIYVH